MLESESLGFHLTKGLYLKKVDEGIKITKLGTGKVIPEYIQVETLESMASALAACTPSGDTAEQHKRFMSLFSS